MSKKLFTLLGLLVVFSMLLVACGGNEAPANEGPAAEEPAAEEPAAEPTEEPVVRTTRVGGWLDTVAFSIVGPDAAVTQIEADAIDIFPSGLATAEDYAAIDAAGLEGSITFGINYEITFNPVGPTFEGTGAFNPFSNKKIREAMNWLIDRDYLNQEIYGGYAVPRFVPFTSGFPEYARNIELIRAVEILYQPDPDRANEVITAEMEAMGAELVDGKWTYEGEPVTLIFLIRTDSDGTRLPMGNIISTWLEDIGFTVDRRYGTSSELSPFWLNGNPNDGDWHLYTGAWGIGGIPRSSADNIQDFYSANGGLGFSPLWQSYVNSEEFEDAANKLANNLYANQEERAALMAEVFPELFENSYRVWVADGVTTIARTPEVQVSYDLAAGVDISPLWPFTLRFRDQEGGVMRWGTVDVFVDPYNPVAGSNWTWDTQVYVAVSDAGVFLNPYTGLALPQRIERGEVTVLSDKPVTKTYDWVDLSFADEITVPGDAWIDWDVENEVFVTVDEAFPDGLTATTKSVVYYPAELYDVTWHDGSPMSAADFVMPMIMQFATGMEGSALFDSAAANQLESFRSSFKGVRIVSTDPLTIETYTDLWEEDAENNVTTWWPFYGQYDGAWHQIAMMNLADAAGEAAYSNVKADELEIEQINVLGGPTLELLNTKLDQLIAENSIPFEATLGAYITADEAASRYANMKAFYEDHGHFMFGTGAYILDEVFLVEKTLTLVHNPNYPDLADKWAIFAEPKIAEVAVDGAGRVPAGTEAVFDVFVTFQGEAYEADQIDEIKYLLFGPTGELLESGVADLVTDGQYMVTLSEETTAAFEAGAYKLEVIAVAIPVAIPSFSTFEFVSE